MTFRFERLKIPEVILVEALKHSDDRGFFRETYKQSEFAAHGIALPFVQDNHSHSARGVLRGLHFQKLPKAQGKLVIVSSGEIFDVAVDLRAGSPTYGHWLAQVLSAENGCMLFVPPGFAHGFCVTSDEADVMYKVTSEFAAELDRGIIWNDSTLGIRWPVSQPLLSPKDARLPLLKDADNNFRVREM
jgi:dTDP-4-dehydrorhamnose 3,5-epimerase